MGSENCESILIIIAGDNAPDIDYAMKTRPAIKTLVGHSFDFPSWEERDCVDIFERHARHAGFLLGEGVREKVADGCLACRTLHSCVKGHDVNKLWRLLVLTLHRAFRVCASPEIEKTIQFDGMKVVDSMCKEAGV
jgi:hypothetical protein